MKETNKNAQNAGMNFKICLCSYDAAKYATTNWHYSKSMPSGKIVMFGIWEYEKFMGCILFSRGASSNIGKPYGLKNTEICELTRVALRNDHEKQVTFYLAKAIKELKKTNPGLKLIVSYADSNQNHLGIIYQAGNWIFAGKTSEVYLYFDKSGRKYHSRQVSEKGYNIQFGVKRNCPKPSELNKVKQKCKFRYLYPLDKKTRKKFVH